jgi:hypothetical protein
VVQIKYKREMKKYTIEIIDVDGKLSVKRINDGFNCYEILGFVTQAQHEIVEMIKGNMKPDKVERIFIDHEKEELKIDQKVLYPGNECGDYWIEEIDEINHRVLLRTTESSDDPEYDDFWVYKSILTPVK